MMHPRRRRPQLLLPAAALHLLFLASRAGAAFEYDFDGGLDGEAPDRPLLYETGAAVATVHQGVEVLHSQGAAEEDKIKRKREHKKGDPSRKGKSEKGTSSKAAKPTPNPTTPNPTANPTENSPPGTPPTRDPTRQPANRPTSGPMPPTTPNPRARIISGNENELNYLFKDNGLEIAEPPITLPGGNQATWSLAVEDMNGDGFSDIIIGNNGEWPNQDWPNQLLLNDGSDGFPSVASLPSIHTDNGNTRSIAVADVDGDGDLDIIVGNYRQANELLLNDGSGSFNATELPDGMFLTNSIAVDDVNGDGLPDIVVGNELGPDKLLLNDGNGGFPSATNLPGGSWTYSVVIADVNNDLFLDIVTTDSVGRKKHVFFNTGDQSDPFSSATEIAGAGLYAVAVADVDSDGDLDIVTDGLSGAELLLNDGSGFFNASTLPGTSTATRDVAIIDFNCDGDLDILLGNKGEQNQVLLNDGTGSFEESDIIAFGGTRTTYAVAVLNEC